MRKIILSICSVGFLATAASAQSIMKMHGGTNTLYQNSITNVDSLKFTSSNTSVFDASTNFALPNLGIDSITFDNGLDSNKIYIIYNGNNATIINPYASSGVTITATNADVTVASTHTTSNLEYNILGTTTNGSLSLASTQPVRLVMSNANITSTSGAPIKVTSNILSTINLSNATTNSLVDATASTANATLQTVGSFAFEGNGTLNVTGMKKHAVLATYGITVNSGVINIPHAVSDAMHADTYLQNGGTLVFTPNGDGVDATTTASVNNGSLTVTLDTADTKGVKSKTINVTGGNVTIAAKGNQTKGLSSSILANITGGSINITASGTLVLAASGSGFDPSYCTGIKSDSKVIISGGSLMITCAASNAGGRGISADTSVTITGGTINISTAGGGTTYTNTSGVIDSYTPTCIKSDGHIYLNAGTITLASTGLGGKGVSADSTLNIGVLNAANNLLTITASTSGNRFLVSGTGQNADYANPKILKAEGNVYVNSGIINVTGTTEGGEGIESKAGVYIKGGQITANTYDDCVNAASHIEVTGGNHSLKATNNDGMDSNGDLVLSGGFVISNGAGGPEEGFDCDNNTFKMLGGVMLGTGGNTSNPTANVSTQNTLKITTAPGNMICIKNAAGTPILIYQLPTISSTGPGGGNMVILFSDPGLTNGTGYTISKGGTVTGGTTVNGYNTGGTYTGGTTQTFNITNKLTTISL